jgi:hypothetical protein
MQNELNFEKCGSEGREKVEWSLMLLLLIVALFKYILTCTGCRPIASNLIEWCSWTVVAKGLEECGAGLFQYRFTNRHSPDTSGWTVFRLKFQPGTSWLCLQFYGAVATETCLFHVGLNQSYFLCRKPLYLSVPAEVREEMKWAGMRRHHT